jgi:predicted amidophosphoribosyltransferase
MADPMTDEPQSTRSFTWPPRTATDDVTEPAAASITLDPSLPRRRPIDVFHAFERTFMGVATASFEHRAKESGWIADDPDAYCARCGHRVGPHEYCEADGCHRCRSKRVPWDRALRLGSYDGLLRDAILETKFTRWRHIGEQLGMRLGASLASALAPKGLTPADAVLVPVPTSTRRRLARGIDHTLVIARGMRRSTGIEIRRALSARFGPTQVGTPSSRRERNVSDRFQIRRGVALESPIVVLVDDVRTTGATLRTAAKTLRQGVGASSDRDSGPLGSIWIATIAVAES